MRLRHKYILAFLSLSILTVGLCSCDKEGSRDVRAFVMMSFGFNNLNSYLSEDISEVQTGYIPGDSKKDNLFFIYSHSLSKGYSTPTSPVLFRVYKDRHGVIVRDTLLTLTAGSIPNSAENMARVLNYIKDNYSPGSVGVLMSSHGTGWAPPGYCDSPDSYEKGTSTSSGSSSDGISLFGGNEAERKTVSGAGNGHITGSEAAGENWKEGENIVPYSPSENFPPVKGAAKPYSEDSFTPMVKSFAATVTDGKGKEAYQTEMKELAKGIPYKLSYLIFDACYMGGVEVAYELRDRCRWLCFSQTEILAYGMVYSKMISQLLGGGTPDVEAVCRSYFEQYNSQTGYMQSATISLVDCSKIYLLARLCREFFSSYEVNINTCNSELLQRYFRDTTDGHKQRWFYDLLSIVKAAGASEEELETFQAVLDVCVPYKAATPEFMKGWGGFEIDCHSGLSMYLPYTDRNYLNTYYKTLGWNTATDLVK